MPGVHQCDGHSECRVRVRVVRAKQTDKESTLLIGLGSKWQLVCTVHGHVQELLLSFFK